MMNNYESSPQAAALATLELSRRRKKSQTFEEWLKETSPKYNWDFPHLKLIRTYLDKILNGEKQYLIILAPPQTSKSLHITIHFAAHVLEKFPEKRIIVGAYNHTYATDFSIATKRLLIQNNFKFAGKQLSYEWETAKGGFYKAFGMQSGITGKSSDLTIIDDPIKNAEEAFSQKIREKIWKAFEYNIESREQLDTSYIICMTHWHYDDLVGRILKRDKEKWTVLKFPHLAEENDILGRKVGEILTPLHSLKRVLEIKKNNPAMFAALHQQHPEIDGGNIFKRDKWRYYTTPPNFDYIIQSLDSAWETKAENDYSVLTTWGVSANNIYLINMWRDKVTYPDLKRRVINLAQKYKPHQLLVENTQSGKAIVQELSTSGFLPIYPINPLGSKEARAHACSSLCDSGRIFLPEEAPFLFDFLDELTIFPKALHDDIVDSTTMALNYIMYFNSESISVF